MTSSQSTSGHSLILSLAVAAALAAPLAFAQSTQANANAQDNASAQAATPATRATPATPPSDDASAMSSATPATPATRAEPAADAKKVTWSDLDGDKDGKLSKTEAAPIERLNQVFDAADANKDGALTADEYKAYVAVHGKSGAGNGNG